MKALAVSMVLVSDLMIAGILVIVNAVGIDVSKFTETVSVHMPSWETLVLDDPTFGEVNWRLSELSNRTDDVIVVFLGKVLERDGLFGMLKDSSEDYPNESSLKLSDLKRTFSRSRSLTLILLTTNPVDVGTLRRIAWKGYNILYSRGMNLEPMTRGIRGEADYNNDGIVDLRELAKNLSEKFISFVSENVSLSISEDELLRVAYTKIRKAVRDGTIGVKEALKILELSLTGDWEDLKCVLLFASGGSNLSELLGKIER